MCGICGVLTRAPDIRSHDEHLGAMTALMARRGPDDEGRWTDGAHVAFGFRRLAILDLTPTGHQPMLTRDGRFALVFNGELYNFRELRAELAAHGAPFRSTGDAEVVLESLARWGTDALPRFNGMFALALWNARERSLLLARDHAGIKPLYVLHAREGVVFASQYDQLLAHPWARALDVAPESLGLYLRFGHIAAPRAMLEGTRLVDAGCWLRVDATGRVTEGRFFDLPQYAAPTLRGDAAVEALDDALARAVARHLVADVPVGVFLSGGIDSPLVAAEARRGAGAGLRAFTITVPGSAEDEGEAAARYARELELAQVTRAVDPATAVDLLDDVVAACSEPTADFSIFPTMLVSRLAREHVPVVLSGDGGDELFWGYPSRFASTVEQAPYFAYPRVARYGCIAARHWLGRGRATREILWPTVGRLYQKKHTILPEASLAAIFPDLAPIPADEPLFEYAGTDPDHVAQWVRWNEFRLHLARVLLKVDRASMFHSLEVRVPLLDREVIDVAARTDWRSCLTLHDRVGKQPLREALRRRIGWQTRAKKGFTVPMHDWLAGPLREPLRELVLARREILGLPLDPRPLVDLEARLRGGDRTVAWGLWLLLALALWEQHHLARRPAALAA